MVSLRSRILAALALAAVIIGVPTYVESAADGRISGVVRDTTGAALPGATVTITNQATNTAQTVTTAGDGSFSANLPPGVYSVTASIRGFGRKTQRDLTVDTGASVAADLALQPQRGGPERG